MIETILYILGAFLLYLLLLPAFGAVIGLFLYMGLPYLAGLAVACIAHKILHGSFFDLGAFWIIALLWSILLVQVRKIFQKAFELEQAWHEGHYLAAATILLMGQPYRKMKKALST